MGGNDNAGQHVVNCPFAAIGSVQTHNSRQGTVTARKARKKGDSPYCRLR